MTDIKQLIERGRMQHTCAVCKELSDALERLQASNAQLQAERDGLASQNYRLKEALIGWRQRTWPGTDQRSVIEKEFPALAKIEGSKS